MTSLEALEALDKILHYIEKQYGEKLEKIVFTKSDEAFEIETLRKELKALKIIKEKRVNVRAFLKSCRDNNYGLTIYNSSCDNNQERESKELTQEEYDLLKEVLE